MRKEGGEGEGWKEERGMGEKRKGGEGERERKDEGRRVRGEGEDTITCQDKLLSSPSMAIVSGRNRERREKKRKGGDRKIRVRDRSDALTDG